MKTLAHALTITAMALAALTALTALTPSANAGSYGYYSGKDYKKEVIVEDVPLCNFRDMEFQVDGFFTGVAAQSSHGNTINSGLGGGAGLNFIFARYFGIGTEMNWYSNNGVAEHILLGSFILRYPICSINIAPYAMVGGGAGWDGTTTGFGHVGGGLEWRPHPNVGWFADGRYLYGTANPAALMRTGVRFAF